MQNITNYYKLFKTDDSAPLRTFRWRVSKLSDEEVTEMKGFRTPLGNGLMVFVPMGRCELLDKLMEK